MVNTILLVILSFAGGFLVAFVTSSLIWDPDDRYDKEATYRERKIPASEIREECVSSGDRTRLVACPECEGASISTSDVGGITSGGCETCGGTGLVAEEEVEKSV